MGEVREISEAELDAMVEARSRELKDRGQSRGTFSASELDALIDERARARLGKGQVAEAKPAPIGPFDRVVLTTDDGKVHDLTRGQFERLPLDERVRAVLRKQLKFYCRGAEMPMRDALKNY